MLEPKEFSRDRYSGIAKINEKARLIINSTETILFVWHVALKPLEKFIITLILTLLSLNLQIESISPVYAEATPANLMPT